MTREFCCCGWKDLIVHLAFWWSLCWNACVISRFESIHSQDRSKKKISRFYHVHNWLSLLIKTHFSPCLAVLACCHKSSSLRLDVNFYLKERGFFCVKVLIKSFAFTSSQELIPDDQSLFDSSFNDPYKPLKPTQKNDYYSKKRPLEAELEEPLAKRPYVPNNDFVERNSPSPVPQNLSHEKRVIVPAGKF